MAVVDAGPESELLPGQSACIFVDDTPIAIFNVNGEFFAIGDTCTHEDFSLSEGEVFDDATVECALHGSRFDLRTGDALSLPATGNAGSYSVWVEDGQIKIEVP
jgi:3-phenylpropionate/trans-cinnamate dioxygenase ferredoxin component